MRVETVIQEFESKEEGQGSARLRWRSDGGEIRQVREARACLKATERESVGKERLNI